MNGKKIIDFNNNNLHILNYSCPVNEIINLEDLQKKLYYLEKFPNTIPYLTSYYKEQWGFCLTYNQYKQLKDSKYKVVIDSSLENGFLTYGELIIKGQVEKEILLSCYICHPSMCNDSLSGVGLLTILAKKLLEKSNYYTYRIIFIPETIGSITYLHYNLDKMKSNVIGGYVITCVGDEGGFTYLETRKTGQLVDKITDYVFNEKNIINNKSHFLSCGSDERQFNYPGIDLNIGSIMKTQYGKFDEYHTSDDNLLFIKPKALNDSFEIYERCLYIFENNKNFINIKLCEPRLSKYNIYSDIGGLSKYNTDSNIGANILKTFYYLDGNNDVISISKILNITFDKLMNIINLLLELKLIKVVF
jgi:aminopeptidase-like protein